MEADVNNTLGLETGICEIGGFGFLLANLQLRFLVMLVSFFLNTGGEAIRNIPGNPSSSHFSSSDWSPF